MNKFQVRRNSVPFISHTNNAISAYTIGHRQAEQRIKLVLNVKQHKRVNGNSLN